MSDLYSQLASVVGDRYVTDDTDVLASYSTDWTGRFHGVGSILVRPGNATDVSAVLDVAHSRGVPVTVSGGRTSLVGGTVPEHGDILLSTTRLTDMAEVDSKAERIRVGAGVTLAAVRSAAERAGLQFGVDIASRDTATVGGMAATDAGGLHTVRFGSMGAQVKGLEIVLPDGSIVNRHSDVRADNTGYDMTAMWVGSEGTLGIITALDLALHRIPTQLVTAVLGFETLSELVRASTALRSIDGTTALEMIDGNGLQLASERLNIDFAALGSHRWYVLLEVGGDDDPFDRVASVLETIDIVGEPNVATDAAGRQRLWRARECFAEVVGLFGPPVKFDLALPVDAIESFYADAEALIGKLEPDAITVLFGHIAEANLHLNVLNLKDDSAIYAPMMELIRERGGNVSSEHGVGTRKREYLELSRSRSDIEAMWMIKRAFDPDVILNRAVMFPDWVRRT